MCHAVRHPPVADGAALQGTRDLFGGEAIKLNPNAVAPVR